MQKEEQVKLSRKDIYHLPKEQKLLSNRDHDLVLTLKTILKIEGHKYFTSDTLRRYNLDRFFVDKQHGIGGFFARLLANDLIREVGRVRSSFPSNHGREIRQFCFNDGEMERGKC